MSNHRYESNASYVGHAIARDDLGFNWGAFLLAPLWLLFHGRIGTGLLLIVFNLASSSGLLSRYLCDIGVANEEAAFVTMILVQIAIAFHYGVAGNKIAWKKKGYVSLQALREGERSWKIAGIVLSAILLILLLVPFILAVILF